MIDGCERADLGGRSVARVWDEALLDGIRRDVPAPTVHARNLFHTSAAMWDAWAAYDPDAEGYFVDEKHEADDVRARRGGELRRLPGPPPPLLLRRRAPGNVRRAGRDHGVPLLPDRLHQHRGRLARGARQPHRPGRDRRGARRRLAGAAPLRRHRLPAGEPAAGGGRPGRPDGRPEPVAASPWRRTWRRTGCRYRGTSSASSGRSGGTRRPPGFGRRLPVDPGPPPRLGDDPASTQAFQQAAVDVILDSSYLDPGDGATIDIGPGAFGDNPLGTNDGDGRRQPVDEGPYAPTSWRGATSRRAGRVLGRRPRVGDTPRPLEHHRQRRVRQP